jgi:hypothetical protein
MIDDNSAAVFKARDLLREQGVDPATVDYNRALAALDALCETEPDHAAARWYREASKEACQRFARTWSRYRRKKQLLLAPRLTCRPIIGYNCLVVDPDVDDYNILQPISDRPLGAVWRTIGTNTS